MFSFLPGRRGPDLVQPDTEGVQEAVVPATAGADPLPRRGLVFAIVALALFMFSIDQTIVATALSTISRDLHGSIEWTSWTITVYSLGQIVVMPLAGKLSDVYGRKQVFVVAVVLFTAASLCCGLSTDVTLLVVLRAVQAIGGGAFLPSATGIVADHFGRNRDRALGMFTSIFPAGAIVGPILGGIFVTGWSWRAIFLVNVPIGVVLLLLAVVFIPRGERRAVARFDIVGVALLGVLLLSSMFGIAYLGGADVGLSSPGFILPESIAVVALVAFLAHTRLARSPFIPMRLLRGRGFGVMNLINFLYGAAALGFAALVPLYAQDRFGLPVLLAGTLLTARAVGMILVAGMAVFALRRTGYRIPMMVGFAVIAAGLLTMALAPTDGPSYLWLSVAGAITGIGMGFCVPASNNATLNLAEAEGEVAGTAGLRGMFRQVGAIMGISITTAVLARSPHPGAAFSWVFIVFSAILIAVIPLVLLVPEHRGRW
jgi:EmrB/QacA subfamily drug resistance transporter